MNRMPNLPSPPGYETAYAQSYQLAFDRLAESDPVILCQRTGASLTPDSKLELAFLNTQVIVEIKQRTLDAPGHPLSITDKLPILHYLVTASGRPKTGKSISFKDLPEGAGYFPTFYKRAIGPVVHKFGNAHGDLAAAALKLGGNPIDLGDVGVSIPVFPKISIDWILWRGDGVLPPEGSILFDSSVTGYLPVEDIAVLCHSIANRLCENKAEL